MFLCNNQWEFGKFSLLWLWNRFSGKRLKTFFKKLEYRFLVTALRLKTHHIHTKLPYQKPMLRQIEWWIQNGPITKNGVLPVTTLFFWKFCFSLRISYKELIWCTNNPNICIRNFCKHWSFIWRCFFPVSILKWLRVEQLQNVDLRTLPHLWTK